MASLYIILFTLYLVTCIIIAAEQVYNRSPNKQCNIFGIVLQLIVNISAHSLLLSTLYTAIFYLK